MNFLWCFIYLLLMEGSIGRPVLTPSIHVPSPEIIKFMRTFGYLDPVPSDSEALYHESAIIDAIKNIQKFGAINQTGILDHQTLQLLTAPRCGVPDIEARRRRKRYVVGAKRWQKRNINYFIANWSAKVGEEKVATDMARAFEIWSRYSNLKFTRAYDPSADIIVAFGAGYHGDNYPFDGPGNILAHAFYPYEMQSYGGDIHFDNDENWKENSTNLADGVDFFSVAVHELGHSLGLAHSPVYSSIMFPYYKGAGSNSLDYDDILAMYNLYISATFVDDHLETSTYPSIESTTQISFIPQTTTRATTTTTTTRATTKTTTRATWRPVTARPTTPATKTPFQPKPTYEGDYESVDAHQRKHGFIPTGTPPQITTSSSWSTRTSTSPNPITTTTTTKMTTTTIRQDIIPKICLGHFDAVCVFRGDVFIFKGEYIWRLTEKYRIMNGYPIKISDMFPFLPSYVKNINAAYERNDESLVLFSGRQYWVFDGYQLIENSPRQISDFGIDISVPRIDAAMIWPKNQRTYLFAGNEFWRFNEEYRILEDGYPRNMSRWLGIPDNIDAVATMPSGKTYFFKGNLYWLYNNKWVRPERGYPRRASNAWLGCPLMQQQRRRQNFRN